MESIFPVHNTTTNSIINKPFFSFNAGKMSAQLITDNPKKYLITPELVKGKISVVVGEDSLIHFQWTNRQTSSVVDDFILVPNDTVFSKINTGKDKDRVFMLRYKSSERRYFYWLQYTDSEKDEENIKKITNILTNPSSIDSNRNNNSTTTNPDSAALLNIINSFGNNQRVPTNGNNSTTNSNPATLQLADLQNILAGMRNNPTPANVPTSATTAPTAVPTTETTTTTTVNESETSLMQTDEMTEEEMLRLAIEESMRDNNSNNNNNDEKNNENSK